MHVKEPTSLLAKSRRNPGEVARQHKPAAIFGWWGLRVTVMKLTFRHPGRPGDCQIINNNNNTNNSTQQTLSVESQKGVNNAVQRCSLENQKGAITRQIFIAIVPFWFSTEHCWTLLMPFWLSADDAYLLKWFYFAITPTSIRPQRVLPQTSPE